MEQVDKRFLADRFGSRKGMLLKPSTFGAFKYLGEDWEPYKEHYNPKTDITSEQGRRLIEFTKLIQQSNDLTFKQNFHYVQPNQPNAEYRNLLIQYPRHRLCNRSD